MNSFNFCPHCGTRINSYFNFCPRCGFNFRTTPIPSNNQLPPTNIVNVNQSCNYIPRPVVYPRRYSALGDLIMIFLTGGLWVFWMIIRPKY